MDGGIMSCFFVYLSSTQTALPCCNIHTHTHQWWTLPCKAPTYSRTLQRNQSGNEDWTIWLLDSHSNHQAMPPHSNIDLTQIVKYFSLHKFYKEEPITVMNEHILHFLCMHLCCMCPLLSVQMTMCWLYLFKVTSQGWIIRRCTCTHVWD